MGFLYDKLYVQSIHRLFTPENALVNHVLKLYRKRQILPADLGVDLCDFGDGASLSIAVESINRLSSNSGPPPSPTLVQACCPSTVPEERVTMVQLIHRARTPLGCISSIRQAIEDIVEAVRKVEPGLRVAPDDLIPLLAWIMVKSDIVDTESLLFWIKTFRLGDDLAPENE